MSADEQRALEEHGAAEEGVEPERLARIPPEVALRPVRSDAVALLTLWFVRKSFWWLLWLGLISAGIFGQANDIDIDYGSPRSVLAGIASPLAALIVAFIVRFVSGFGALALTLPLARAHDQELEPRTGFGSSIGVWLDRLQVARAYRSLRWTHHVRQLALRRLGPAGRRLSRLDPILDVANVGLAFVAVGVLILTAPDTA